MSVWHDDGYNVSTLEKKTIKIYHVLEDLNYGIWEYTRSFGRKSAKKKSTRRLIKELGASKDKIYLFILMQWHLTVTKDNIHRQIETLRKSYKSCRSGPHELTPQQAKRRVDNCHQLIGNPVDDRFIRRIVTYAEKWAYYRNPKPRNSGSVPVNLPKSSLKQMGSAPKYCCVSGGILKV